MELGFDVIATLFGVATVAGFIDAIAGGGGLLTIPALLSTGLPPAVALGTNKLQACGGSFSALFCSQKSGRFKTGCIADFINIYWCCSWYDCSAKY